MIEKIILSYLKDKSLNVYMEMPKNPPQSFVVLEKTGSRKLNHINTATIAIQSYGSTMLKAAELNDKIKKYLDDIIQLDNIANVELQGDYNFTDTSTKRYRYQAVYDFVYYE